MSPEFSYSDKQYNALQQAAYQLASCTDQLFQQIDQQQALNRIIDKIRASSELDTLFKTTTFEVRQLLNADRVGVFYFDPDSGYNDGELVSEDVAPDLPSALAVKVQDHCFGSQFATYYTQGRVQAVADIYQEGLSDCHIQILEQFQVRANLVVPILKGHELWGLLCVHQCNMPRRWQLAEIEFVRKIANHFAVALQQAEYLEQIRHQAVLLAESQAQKKALARQRALVKITNRIRQSLEWGSICQTATDEVRQILATDRVAIYQFNADWSGDFRYESVAAGWQPLLHVTTTITDTHLVETQGGRYAHNETYAVNDIYQAGHDSCHVELLETLQARAYVLVPIFQSDRLWGLLATYQNDGPRQWQEDEVELLRQVGEQLGIALQQAYEQLQKLNRQRALVKITQQIRQPKTWEVICQTATDELRQHLGVDRAAIYKFNADWSGDFLFESVVGDWQPLVGLVPTVEDTYLQETHGGRYAKGEAFAVADIYQVGHEDCHIKLLESFQARAYAIAPIFQRQHLWGLLAIYQNSAPRHWQEDEVELLTQVGEQLGIALQQQADEQQKKLDRQKTLVKIVSKVRNSLNFDEICKITTHEVRNLLQADRVAIYQFNPDWSGQFVSESVGSEWVSVLQIQDNSPVVQSSLNSCSVQSLLRNVNDTYLQATQGGDFTRDNIYRACSDIYDSSLSDCHIDALASYQVRSYAIVAIYIDDQYWGLLAAYQNSNARNWKDDEIQLLVQIGEQLGIALQRSRFVNTIQKQAQELNQAFKELQQSQVQLIQNEKMASLGQLVAGTAHEINNPVNFIYGNLSHVENYIADLTDLIVTYQEAVDLNTPAMTSVQEKIEEIELDFLLEDLPKTLGSMRIGTNRIRDIVLSLRNFSRLDEAEIKAVDIHEGIDSTLLILSNRIRHCSDRDLPVKVTKNYGDIPMLECYPAQLNQVFMNILANALDALDEAFGAEKVASEKAAREATVANSPCIWIATTASDNRQIEVQIRDNGLGMTQTTQNRIFDHFFTTKAIGKGTGLGLAITHQLVTEKHKGAIAVRSTLGEGTVFKITLPLNANRAT